MRNRCPKIFLYFLIASVVFPTSLCTSLLLLSCHTVSVLMGPKILLPILRPTFSSSHFKILFLKLSVSDDYRLSDLHLCDCGRIFAPHDSAFLQDDKVLVQSVISVSLSTTTCFSVFLHSPCSISRFRPFDLALFLPWLDYSNVVGRFFVFSLRLLVLPICIVFCLLISYFQLLNSNASLLLCMYVTINLLLPPSRLNP